MTNTHSPTFCLPIQKNSFVEVRKILDQEKRKGEYRYFEIWLDLIENIDENAIQELIDIYQDQLILLFRRPNLEKIQISFNMRKNIIDMLKNKNILLDLDMSQDHELDYIKEKKLSIPLVFSYHNYHETPSNQDLLNIIEQMKEYKPTIYKLATMCNNDSDALRIMNLLQEIKKSNIAYVVLGMGQLGKITRVYGMLQGNKINYVPRMLDEQSANGQLTIDRMKSIYNILF